MTYRELIAELEKLNPEQLAANVSIIEPGGGEIYAAALFLYDGDILDAGHPVLVAAGPYVRVIDTLCDGWQALTDGDGKPVLYATEAEAEKEIRGDFDELNRNRIASGFEPDAEPDEFAVALSEYIPGRKAIFTGGNPPGYITGANE